MISSPAISKPSYINLPKLLFKPFSHLPFPAQRLALSNGLKRVFQEALDEGECEFLRNRWLLVAIKDLDLYWYFSLGQNDKIIMQSQAIADVTISGNFNEFVLLASRKEDPDTLFFQRRLVIEGDTELGLAVKNLIDSLDIDSLSKELRFLIRSAGEFIEIFGN